MRARIRLGKKALYHAAHLGFVQRLKDSAWHQIFAGRLNQIRRLLIDLLCASEEQAVAILAEEHDQLLVKGLPICSGNFIQTVTEKEQAPLAEEHVKMRADMVHAGKIAGSEESAQREVRRIGYIESLHHWRIIL